MAPVMHKKNNYLNSNGYIYCVYILQHYSYCHLCLTNFAPSNTFYFTGLCISADVALLFSPVIESEVYPVQVSHFGEFKLQEFCQINTSY
jgi:hypothetical protein